MADYCKQCAIKYFDQDTRDLAGLSKPEDTEAGMFCQVICEGCGFIQVDHEGNCVSDCLEHHKRDEENKPM